MNKKFTLVMGTVLLVLSMISGSRMVNLAANTTPGVVLSVEPSVKKVDLGESFIVAVGIADVRDLNKWEIQISWDATVIELDLSNANMVEEGSFLKSVGTTKFEVSSYKNGSGLLPRITCNLLQAKGASGSGTLLRLNFRAIVGGETSIAISESKLYDFMLRNIFHECNSGKVYIGSAVRDIAIALFECPTSVVLNQSTQLDVTIENKGTVVETNVEVEIYINGNLTNSTTIPELAVDSQKSCRFLWTPASIGTYNISAYVTPVSGEAEIGNNYRVLLVEVVIHDVAVFLQCPAQLVLNCSVLLNATVTNLGSFDEANVKLSIIINGAVNKSESIALLTAGSSKQFAYLWNPAYEGTYNVTAYVHEVAGEIYILNNRVSQHGCVVNPSIKPRILIVAGDNGDWHKNGTSLSQFEHALRSAGYEYDVWKESENGNPSLDTLLEYKLVIWTVGDYLMKAINAKDIQILKEYLSKGGNILIEGQFIAYENPPSQSDIWKSILHISLEGCNLETSGLTVTNPNHTIVRGLPSDLTWQWTSTSGHDGPCPAYGSYEVIRFSGNNYTAVNVFDGTQSGVGSVIYYSFTLQWLQESWADILVANCVEWTTRLGVSVVGSRIVHAAENSMYFIYADPSIAGINSGSYMPSGSIVYSLCKNHQHQGFDSTQKWLSPSTINNALFALFGNPLNNKIISQYEIEAGLSPIIYCNDSERFMFMTRNGDVAVSLPIENVTSGRNDAFVIYIFTDLETNNTFLVMYGFGWRGCWAAEIYFVNVITNNFPSYSETCHVFSWTDCNDNGIPEIQEIVPEISG